MCQLVNLLSKKARENLTDVNTYELLSEDFSNTNSYLTKGDKDKLAIIREAFATYKTGEIKNMKITSTGLAGQYFISQIGESEREELMVILLDSKNQILKSEIVFKGTVNSSVAHPREIFKLAVQYPTARIMVAHNHPSGDTEPSHADLLFTRRLKMCGEMMGIELLDHIIVGYGNYYSMRERTDVFDDRF
ncbi:JAB domain-containing protein [Hutsoniella sourekii]|uniref:JAB domain-containing protein n=1 Tax=Hutsoniella sourekii TaxID=87650 RepID=UPI0004ACA420|nr:JAB domain-containing protein [Hutsoniella sourekii]